ncbi:MAG: hypothetical protein HRF49_03585 [bacterium]
MDCSSLLVDTQDEAYETDPDESGIAAGDIDAEEAFASGMAAYEEDEFEDALELFNDVIRAEKDHHEAYNMLGLTFAALDMPREAWRSFKHALRTQENDKYTLFYVADFLADVGDYEMAKHFAERHLEQEEDPAEREEMEEILQKVNAHLAAGDRGGFMADMNIDMESLTSMCLECKARLPVDAPYCPVCGAVHIYPEDADEYEGFERGGDWDDDDEEEESLVSEEEDSFVDDDEEDLEDEEDRY